MFLSQNDTILAKYKRFVLPEYQLTLQKKNVKKSRQKRFSLFYSPSKALGRWYKYDFEMKNCIKSILTSAIVTSQFDILRQTKA